MGRGKDLSPSVKNFFNQTKELLSLHPVTGRKGFTKAMVSVSSRSASSPVLILGKRKIQSFKSLSRRNKLVLFADLLDGGISCVVLAEGIDPPPELRLKAEERGLALFVAEASIRTCQKTVKDFLVRSLSNELLAPGGMLQMFGLGVLIIGDSGIGKSESALELISRGHRFVSDDVTLFSQNQDSLYGCAPDFSRNFMEIRGLGIINIKEIFGADSLCRRARLDLVINLKRWEEGREYDRLGLKFPDSYEILGKKVSQIIIPVAPGRSIATLIEVACKVYLCRQNGYYATEELLEKLDRALSPEPSARGKK
jgi:HPr kinase/phosphorylase